MGVKQAAEKFRVGNRVRLLERKVLKLQKFIAAISMVCMILAVLAQEICYIGTYSNALGGDWFAQTAVQEKITSADLVTVSDSRLVLLIKFVLTKLTVIQLIMMRAQFKLITSIMIEQKQLDVNMLDMDLDKGEQPPVPTLAGSLGYSSSYIVLFKFCLEFALCAVHPPPFVKKRYVTTIIGRDAVYNLDSLVTLPTLPPRTLPHCANACLPQSLRSLCFHLSSPASRGPLSPQHK